MKKSVLIFSFALLVSVYGMGTQAEEAAAQPAVAEPQPAPAAAMPATEATQPASSNQTAHDNHTDYRYCLELKTNKEIIECRYKKKQ